MEFSVFDGIQMRNVVIVMEKVYVDKQEDTFLENFLKEFKKRENNGKSRH